jgi:hypothetical protein
MTLREQVQEIAYRKFDRKFDKVGVDGIGLTQIVFALATYFFDNQVPESKDTRAVRRMIRVLKDTPGDSPEISETEPSVE